MTRRQRGSGRGTDGFLCGRKQAGLSGGGFHPLGSSERKF
jgi:hypothetical protein